MDFEGFSVVADYADFLVIDKAHNVSVHRDQGDSALVGRVAAQTGHGQLYLVHRLDRMTSGLLLLAKSSAACASLAALFAARRVEKYYFALSTQKPHKKQGLVQGDMERSRNGSWRLLRSRHNPARTRFVTRSVRPGLRLFILRPETGRTHQLRVMMKSLGAPILGDQRYGGGVSDRGYLHAYALRFEYAGELVTLCSLPRQGDWFEAADVRAALESSAEPWNIAWPGAKPPVNDTVEQAGDVETTAMETTGIKMADKETTGEARESGNRKA